MDHDSLLFLSQLLIGFHVLLCLSELCFPNCLVLRDFSKISLQSSVQWLPCVFSFWLPSHKADPTFEGCCLIVQHIYDSPDTHLAFSNYLHSRDQLFLFNSELWLCAIRKVPMHLLFIKYLARYFPKDIGG
ncbi:hypothetical protein PILCRDRAFT_77306 [Piloderma croceum F 1598]|uniref:Uncharacterized protein n=1 Tax=Piloderma croceum (strain F 1598) TaxID=765440 RepID=A0A0C3BHP2_PILCF|nr:hypothetical protein PILCRDRAFT_77306 [Piloderma croceum F 1598]